MAGGFERHSLSRRNSFSEYNMPSSRLPEIRFARSPKRLRIQTEQEHQQLLRMEENQVKVQEVQQLQQMVSAVQASVDDYEARRQSMIQELKSVTVELAVAVAAKLLMREVNESEQFVEALVSEQLQSINQGLEINVALSSGDFQALAARASSAALTEQSMRTG